MKKIYKLILSEPEKLKKMKKRANQFNNSTNSSFKIKNIGQPKN